VADEDDVQGGKAGGHAAECTGQSRGRSPYTWRT
jgi:hypothetical protein